MTGGRVEHIRSYDSYEVESSRIIPDPTRLNRKERYVSGRQVIAGQ